MAEWKDFSCEQNWFLGARGCGEHTNSQIVNVSSYSNEQHTNATMKEANTEWKTENDEKTQFEFNYRKFLIDRFALHAVAEMFFLCSLCICGTLITMRLDMRAERVAQMLNREKRARKWSVFFRRNKLSRRRLIMNCDECEVHFRFRINVSRVEDDQLWCCKSWVIFVSWQRGLNFSGNLVNTGNKECIAVIRELYHWITIFHSNVHVLQSPLIRKTHIAVLVEFNFQSAVFIIYTCFVHFTLPCHRQTPIKRLLMSQNWCFPTRMPTTLNQSERPTSVNFSHLPLSRSLKKCHSTTEQFTRARNNCGNIPCRWLGGTTNDKTRAAACEQVRSWLQWFFGEFRETNFCGDGNLKFVKLFVCSRSYA